MNSINTEIFKTNRLDINALVNYIDASVSEAALATREVAQMFKVTMEVAAEIKTAASIQMSF